MDNLFVYGQSTSNTYLLYEPCGNFLAIWLLLTYHRGLLFLHGPCRKSQSRRGWGASLLQCGIPRERCWIPECMWL